MQSSVLSLVQPDVLMCRFVCELLPPTRQGLLRSAGSVGYNAFKELVALGDVPAYVEVVTDGGDVARFGALMNAPIRGVKKPKRRKPKRQVPEEHVIVFWEGAMRRRGMADPSWGHLPWKRVRYHFIPIPSDTPHRYNCFMRSSTATHIEVRGLEFMKETPWGFLYGCTHLQQVEYTCFMNIQVMGDSFMNYAFRGEEEEVGSRPSPAASVGDGGVVRMGAARGTSPSKGVDLGPFTNVTSILNCALVAYNYSTIDLSPLRNVTTIASRFLSNSPKLTSIDLTPFSKLENIGVCFMSGCTGLSSVDLTPLVGVVYIKGSFLTGCTGLTHIDLTPLKGVSSTGDALLQGCTGLHTLQLPTFDNPDAVGVQFVNQCTSLQEIDLSPLHNITSIPPHFLNGCTGLTSIDLTPFSGVKEMSRVGLGPGWIAPDGHFLMGCTGITHLDMSPLVLISKKQKQRAVLNEFSGRVTWGASTSSDWCTMV